MAKMTSEEFEKEILNGRFFIPLGKGYYAEVHEKNVLWLLEYSWSYSNTKGRAFTMIKSKFIEMHKLIAKKMNLIGQIDHKDRDRLNNKEENLRKCTHSQNMVNSKVFKNNKLGLKGVTYSSVDRKYRGQIMKNKMYYYCRFETKEEAHKWVIKMYKLLFGEFSPYD